MAVFRAALLAMAVLAASLPPAARATGDGTFNRVLIPAATAAAAGAACLDGSVPGYYIRTPSAPSDQWVLHAQGGGWCWDEASCLARSGGGLGTSNAWGPTTRCYGECDGILSGNSTTNPDFYTWNAVFIGYCDGGSFTGSRTEPLVYKSKKLYFRGRANLNVVIADLLAKGMDKATDVILTGGSAGGLTAYLQADHVASLLPASTKYRAMGDAGWFLDHPTYTNASFIRPQFTYMAAMMNSSFGTNDACIAANADAPWKCVFAQYTFPYIKSQVFIMEGVYDSWQVHNILQLPCARQGLMATCSKAENASFQAYGATMRTSIGGALSLEPTASAFASACIVHCQSVFNEGQDRWAAWKVDGKFPREVFADWYFGRAGAKPEVEQCNFPCNPSCPVFT